MQPKVSVLIPVYNREKLIGRCIQSALNQSMTDIEVVVVDNASTDDTWDVCSQFAKMDNRVKIFCNATNIGPVRNWYECLKHARGEYVKILYSDDWLEPFFLSKSLSMFNDDVGMVTSSVMIHMKNQEIRYTNNASIHPSKKVVKGFLTYSNNWCVSPSAWIFRRKDFIEIDKIVFENEFGIDYLSHGMGSDTLILLNVAIKYPQIVYIDQTLVNFGCPLDSITGQTDHITYIVNRLVSNSFFVETKRSYLGANFCAVFNLIALIALIRCYGFRGIEKYSMLFTKSYPKFRFSLSLDILKLMIKGSKKRHGKLGEE